jgi:hypothetical protein
VQVLPPALPLEMSSMVVAMDTGPLSVPLLVLVLAVVLVLVLGWLVSGGAGGGVLEAGGLWWGVGAEVEEEV